MTAAKKFGAPKGRLAQLIVESKLAEPYEVTDEIVVPPLTKARGQALSEAENGMNVVNVMLQQAIRTAPVRPEYPAMPKPPEACDAKSLAAYDKSIAGHAGLVAEWEKRHAEWKAAVEELEKSTGELSNTIRQHQAEYSRNLFGPAYDDVMAFFDEQPVEVWNMFIADIKEQFGLAPKVTQVPDDGRCALCGHIEDEESAGKAPESST